MSTTSQGQEDGADRSGHPSDKGPASAGPVSGGGIPERGVLLLVLALAALVLFTHLGMISLWGSEGRWASIARHMYRTGDIFIPVMGRQLYWDKPLVSYWLILPAAIVLGGVDELASRLPSALWALVLLLLTYDLARRWLGDKSALMTALVLSTTYSFVFWGRNAQVEMTNAAVITLILWYFYTRKGSPNSTWIYVMAALAGVGCNMKGLPAVGVPAFCILLRSVVKKDWSWFPRPVALILASGVFLAAFFIIPLVSCLASSSWMPLFMMWKENVLRFFEPFDHKGPIYTYFVRIFDLAAPWSLMIPPALVYYLKGRRERKDDGIMEVLLAFAAIFLFFTLSGSRRSYYLLPILPFAAMLSGHLLAGFFERRLPRGIDIAVMCLGLLISVCLLVPLAGILIKPGAIPYRIEGFLPWGIVIAAGGVVMAASFMRRNVKGVMAPVFLIWLVYVFVLVPWQAGLGDDDRSGAARVVSLNRPLGLLGMHDSKIEFYLDTPYTVLKDMDQANAWAQNGGVVVIDRSIEGPSWKIIVNRKDWKAYVLQKPGS